MSSWAPTQYKTTNWSSYNNALKQHGSLSIWLDPEMVWVPPPRGKRGRPCQFSDAAIQTCLTLKVLFGMVAIESAIDVVDGVRFRHHNVPYWVSLELSNEGSHP